MDTISLRSSWQFALLFLHHQGQRFLKHIEASTASLQGTALVRPIRVPHPTSAHLLDRTFGGRRFHLASRLTMVKHGAEHALHAPAACKLICSSQTAHTAMPRPSALNIRQFRHPLQGTIHPRHPSTEKLTFVKILRRPDPDSQALTPMPCTVFRFVSPPHGRQGCQTPLLQWRAVLSRRPSSSARR